MRKFFIVFLLAAVFLTFAKEKEIRFGSEWPLTGTLLLPDGEQKFPCVLLVHGSGPHDRNENIGPNAVFGDLAKSLQKQGIASFRYDKRTKIHWTRITKLKDFSLDDEVTDDVLLALEVLAKEKALKSGAIFVFGHSLGGMMIPRIAAKTKLPAGYIFFAAPPEDMLTLVKRQLAYQIDNSSMNDLQKITNRLIFSDEQEVRKIVGLEKIQDSYWKEFVSYRPMNLIDQVQAPMLFLQGERDYQVTMQDFLLWKKLLGMNPRATFISYPAVNHIMRPGFGKSLPSEYFQKIAMEPQIAEDIAVFVEKHAN